MKNPRSILITGASSGIGEALALAYAAPDITLALSGRDAERLDAVAAACRAQGAMVECRVLEVTEQATTAEWIQAVDREAALDLVIANAGTSAGTGDGGETEEQARRVLAVNLDGVLNTLLPAIAVMKPRGRGQLAIMSSLAAFRGFPGAPAYCASKAAARVWGESLRGHLKPDGLEVSVICPGFVKSRMTAVNQFPMPFLMGSDKAAAIIRRGLARNKARIAFPWPMALMIWWIAALPPALTDRLLGRLPEKT